MSPRNVPWCNPCLPPPPSFAAIDDGACSIDLVPMEIDAPDGVDLQDVLLTIDGSHGSADHRQR